MSRYLLAIMGVIAVSACTDNHPRDNASYGPGSTPKNEMNNTNSDGSPYGTSTESQKNWKSGNGQDDKSDPIFVGSNRSQSTDRTSVSPVAADRGVRNGPALTARDRNESSLTAGDRKESSLTAGDRKDSSLTAGDQSEGDADRRITQLVRQAVVADPVLSVKAKNSTIITIGGVVTLRGSVDTAAERTSVASKADGVSGVRRVDNQLEIMQ